MADDAPDVVSISTPPAAVADPSAALHDRLERHEERIDSHDARLAEHERDLFSPRPPAEHGHEEYEGEIENLWQAVEALRDDLLDAAASAEAQVPEARTQIEPPPPPPKPAERHPGGLF